MQEDNETATERRQVIATLDLEMIGRLLNLPVGYELVAARPTEYWVPGVDVAVSGPDFPTTPQGGMLPRGYLRLDILEGEQRPERVLVAHIAP